MQEIKMDMDLGAYLIRWTGGGASPALIWQAENGERMICCSNWIVPAKLANMAGAPVSSIEKIASWAHEDAPQPILSSDVAEIRNALGTLGEGMAATLQGIKSLQEAGLRGADRGVAVLDAIKDVGEKVEACMAIASNTEEGLAAAIEKLDKLGVEKWREAIKHVENGETTESPAEWFDRVVLKPATTEPMHAEVKAQPADASGLGKLWADVPTKLEEVSDETLYALAVSGEISEARYFEEFTRRHGIKRDRPTARDVIAMMEKAMLAADEAGVKLDWRVTVGAI